VQVVLFARIMNKINKIKSHTNRQTSNSSNVGMKIEKNILIRPMFIKMVLKSVNSFSFHYVKCVYKIQQGGDVTILFVDAIASNVRQFTNVLYTLNVHYRCLRHPTSPLQCLVGQAWEGGVLNTELAVHEG